MVLLFKEISESPKTRTHIWTQGPQKDSADVIELHSPEGCQTWRSSNGLFCTKGEGCFSQERWGRELSNRECFQRNPPSQLCSHLGSSGEWLGWAAEMGQWQSVHNNRVWVICTVWPDLPCLLSSHPEAISRMKLWIGRGEFLSNYENVLGKGIFTKAC